MLPDESERCQLLVFEAESSDWLLPAVEEERRLMLQFSDPEILPHASRAGMKVPTHRQSFL